MNAMLLWASPGRRYAGNSRLATLMVGVWLFLTLVPSAVRGQTTSDSVAVSTFVKAYRSAWGRHDPSALGRFFAEDADMIMGTDPVSVGRGAIEEWWADYFERQEPERRVDIAIRSLRLVAPDVAVLNVTTTTGGRSRSGDLQPRRARGTWVVVHQAGKWHISAMRGMPTEQDEIVRKNVGQR